VHALRDAIGEARLTLGVTGRLRGAIASPHEGGIPLAPQHEQTPPKHGRHEETNEEEVKVA